MSLRRVGRWKRLPRAWRRECNAAAARAEQTAEAIAGLLLDSLAATFPALCACYCDAEVCAVVRAVLPALTRERAITVRANPVTAAAVAGEFARLDPDLAAHVRTRAVVVQAR